MKRWTILFALLIGLFSFSSAGAASLKDLLTKLEGDLRRGASQKEVQDDLAQIKRLKEKYPVYHIPELNYLFKREVEPIPETRITLIKRVLFFVEPIKRAFEVVIFFLLFYTFIFYSQHIDAEPEKKKYFSLLLVLSLATVVILNLWAGFYFLCGMGVVLALSIRKRRTAVFLLIAGILSIFASSMVNNFLAYLQSPQFLYSLKITRDGYAPRYLIDSAIGNPVYRRVELITNDLALGELGRVRELKTVKTDDPLLVGIIYNDLGYVNFLLGNCQKALKAFRKAHEYLKSPPVLFNLYITYSSLLMLEQANQVKAQLLKENIDISKASPVPILVHVKVPSFTSTVPYTLIAFLTAGLAFALLFDRIFGFYTEQISSGVLQIPGMVSFINSRWSFFAIIFFVALIANYLLGKAICNI